jgi:hypothetical protein
MRTRKFFIKKIEELKKKGMSREKMMYIALMDMIEHYSREHADDDRTFRGNTLKIISLCRSFVNHLK